MGDQISADFQVICYQGIKESIGGEGGIRTLGKVTPTHAFQACSFNHSDTSPMLVSSMDYLDLLARNGRQSILLNDQQRPFLRVR
jgi:hypothetical protein